MNSSIRDIRYADRHLLNRQGVSSLVILILALSIGVTTTIFTVMYAGLMTSLPAARPAEMVLLNDPTGAGTENSRGGVFSHQVYPHLHDRNQYLRHVCVSRKGSASLSQRKAVASGTLAAQTHGSRKQDAAGTRYQAQRGTGYGHFTKRHPFCASQFLAAPGSYRDRDHDAGPGNWYQCGFVLGSQWCA